MPRDDRPPAFLFYVDDFASDGVVEAMTTEGVGAYILLLCKAWREEQPGTLPNDDTVLARWARLASDRWSEVRSCVLAAFVVGSDGRLHQKRMKEEYRKLVELKKRRRSVSQNAANERWKRSYMRPHTDGNPDAPIIEIAIEDEFEKFWIAFPKGRKKSKARAREAFYRAAKKAQASEIITAAAEYAESEAGRGKYVKMPETWLNGECWCDDREAWRDHDKPAGETEYRKVTAAEFKQLFDAQRFKEGPLRSKSDPHWVYGTLRDGSKVECRDYPIPERNA